MLENDDDEAIQRLVDEGKAQNILRRILKKIISGQISNMISIF